MEATSLSSKTFVGITSYSLSDIVRSCYMKSLQATSEGYEVQLLTVLVSVNIYGSGFSSEDRLRCCMLCLNILTYTLQINFVWPPNYTSDGSVVGYAAIASYLQLTIWCGSFSPLSTESHPGRRVISGASNYLHRHCLARSDSASGL